MEAMYRDVTILTTLFEIMKKYSNDDGYVCASLGVLGGELRKVAVIPYPGGLTDPTVRSCIESLAILGYVETHKILSWDGRLGKVSDKNQVRLLLKILTDTVDEEVILGLRAKSQTLEAMKVQIEELQSALREAQKT